MESNKGYMAEGHSVTRPPFFDGTDYPYWKNRMQDEDTWTKDQIAKGTLNWSVLNMMQCAVHPNEYSRVSTCTSAKEMWDKLELIYEGTSEIRESKGHMRGECPELKKKLKKEKFTFKKAKAMLATWSDEDEDENSQATSGDDEIKCLMARSDGSNKEVMKNQWSLMGQGKSVEHPPYESMIV
ncbi:hypothetical protein Taro_024956 [Colocasia esculenta]|uniref:Uncharacterized protein n=1 Tax=Colocasia esculenta TaxID=4460 RepID=A0A843V7L9_COLES|nr:hypothetical protein [Colocasia esculenta]